MNLDVKSLTKIPEKLLPFLKKYGVLIFVLIGLGIFGFLVFRIRTLANTEPSEYQISEKAGESRPINIDKKAVEQVQQLQATNVEVKAFFDQSRDNPFQE